ATFSHDIDLVKNLIGADQSQGDDEEHGGAQQRQRDIGEDLPSIGPIDLRRLIDKVRNVLQRGQEDDHHGDEGGPYVHQHDRRERNTGPADPIPDGQAKQFGAQKLRTAAQRNAQFFEQNVDQTVGGVEPGQRLPSAKGDGFQHLIDQAASLVEK